EDLDGDGIADVDTASIEGDCVEEDCNVLGYSCDSTTDVCYEGCTSSSVCASDYACGSDGLCAKDSDGDGYVDSEECVVADCGNYLCDENVNGCYSDCLTLGDSACFGDYICDSGSVCSVDSDGDGVADSDDDKLIGEDCLSSVACDSGFCESDVCVECSVDSDGDCTSLTGTEEEGTNTAPSMVIQGANSVDEGDEIIIQVVAVDVNDGDTLSYSYSVSPSTGLSGVVIADSDSEEDLFSWTTSSGDAGDYVFTITVSDGIESVSDTVTVTVVVATATTETDCDDGLDNDGDGTIDYSGGDTGCAKANDESELYACEDSLDNDEDEYYDYSGACLLNDEVTILSCEDSLLSGLSGADTCETYCKNQLKKYYNDDEDCSCALDNYEDNSMSKDTDCADVDCGGAYTAVVDEDIYFDGSANSGDIVVFAWTFGDDEIVEPTSISSASEIVATHSYDNEGEYTVTLIVADSFGKAAYCQTTATIGDVSCGTEDIPTCGNGQDDDGDGYTDYAGEVGDDCSSWEGEEDSVYVESVACSTDIDSDGDGLVDFPGACDSDANGAADVDCLSTITKAALCKNYCVDELGYTFVAVGGSCDAVSGAIVAVNHAPTVSISDVSVAEGETVTVTASGSDSDGDSLTYSFSGISSGSSSGEVFTFTPTSSDVGTQTLTVTVSDGTDTGSDTATITVSATAVTTEIDCTDGVDNEGDTFIDCADSECIGSTGALGETCEAT
ncbi:MAG: PKD domain-containing protein, partial [Patescibacteria group bacterium]